MKWNDQDLTYKEDWAAAMKSLTTPEDAAVFLELVKAEQPKYWREILGYLTGDLHPNHAERVRTLLGVTHPLNPKGDERTMAQSFSMGLSMGRIAQKYGAPEWMDLVMKIPRRQWNPYFTEDDAK